MILHELRELIMAENWDEAEFDACTRAYLWMQLAESKGFTPYKKRVRQALIEGPLAARTHGSIEYRFQNISAVLDGRGEPWIPGYKPAKNVGPEAVKKIEGYIDRFRGSRDARRLHWLVNGIPIEIIRRSVSELISGEPFNYPDSTDFDVVLREHALPPKKVIGYAGLLHYDAPLFSENFSAGISSPCFNKIEAAGYEIRAKEIQIESDPVEQAFRVEVERFRRAGFGSTPTGNKQPRQFAHQTASYVRDPAVVAFVELRAGGVCELCGAPAPFNRPDGTPFLEVHHIRFLSEDGPDTVDNAAALCPNCHRACHHSDEQADLKAALADKISAVTRG
ncbi:MAG: HNH endonuclease [Phycisphaeraceae bacterium]